MKVVASDVLGIATKLWVALVHGRLDSLYSADRQQHEHRLVVGTAATGRVVGVALVLKERHLNQPALLSLSQLSAATLPALHHRYPVDGEGLLLSQRRLNCRAHEDQGVPAHVVAVVERMAQSPSPAHAGCLAADIGRDDGEEPLTVVVSSGIEAPGVELDWIVGVQAWVNTKDIGLSAEVWTPQLAVTSLQNHSLKRAV